jgi:hypothetical protein
MRSLMICTLHQILFGHSKENEEHGAYGMYGEERCIQGCIGKS